MNISKELTLKILGALGTTATAAAGLHYGLNSGISWDIFGNKGGDFETIKKSLGLPEDCKLISAEVSESCTINKEQLKSINFENKVSGEIGDDVSVVLKITKVENNFYPGGYKFTFTTTKEIAGPSLKANIDNEFKIKKIASGMVLERIWTISELAEKIRLSCVESSNECTLNGDFNVSDGSNITLLDATVKQSTSGGKIRFEREKEGYYQGFKFTIEDGDIEFTYGGKSEEDKLEKYESYEIKEVGKTWYFSRKNTIQEGKSRALGLPENCNIPAGDEKVECSLNSAQLKNINFEGKNNMAMGYETTTELIIKKVSKDSTDYTSFGNEELNFTFRPSESVVINGNSGNAIKLLKNTNLDFKINNNWKLEKVWKGEGELKNFISAAFPVNLTNKNGTVTRGSQIFMINEENNNELIGLEFEVGNLKVTIEEDQESYNQGIKLKFDKDVSLGIKSSDGVFAEKYKLLSSAFYEIKSGTFSGSERRYLSKK